MRIQSLAAAATLVAITASGIGFLWKNQNSVSDFLHEIFGLERSEFCKRTPQVRDGIMGELNLNKKQCAAVNLTTLADVKELYLSGRSLTGLQSGDFAGLIRLWKLDLGNNQLPELPPGVFDDLTKLESLDLERNQLSKLPPGVFDGLTKLRSIGLERNQLSELPPGVFDSLTKLEWLDLSHNELKPAGLPTGVFDNLRSLDTLYLRDNHLDGLTQTDPLFEQLPGVFIDLGWRL